MKASEGVWQVEQEGQDVRAECRDPSGNLLGFALTGARANPREKTELSKCLGAWLA
jgi:rubredoxin-NAD+ reductase